MNASVFRVALVCSLAGSVACGGCENDGKDGDPWTLGGDMSADATTADVDVAPDTSVAPDMLADADSQEDIGAVDVGVDVDAGDEVVTVVGWYTSAFEHSGFVEDPGRDQALGERPCSPYAGAGDQQRWWVLGSLDANPFVDADDGTGARMRLTGTLTPPGDYGHLGTYDREFTVQEAERLSCETAALGAHCLRPLRSDQCVVPMINDPDASQRHEFVVTYGGASSQSNYDLRVTFNEEVGDGRTDAVVRWRFDGGAPQRLAEVQDLQDLQLIQEQHGLFYNEIEYTNLDGWVLYSLSGADGWYVSISGEDPNGGPPMHVWGWFDVTDTIALP